MMKPNEWRKLMDTLFDKRVSSYERSRAFSRFIQSDATLMHLDVVSNVLADDNQSFRNDALRQVVRNVRPEYYPILADLLDSENDHVVREALHGLEHCHDSEIIAKVEALKESSVSCIRYEAERVLKKMSEGIANWETLADNTPMVPVVECETASTRHPQEAVAGGRPFSSEKTAEITLSLNMLPTDTPYPVHRSSRSRKSKHLNNGNTPAAAATVGSSISAEGVVAAVVSLGAILLVAVIAMGA